MDAAWDIAGVSRIVALEDGRACWVIDWRSSTRRGWCLTPAEWDQADVADALADLMALADASLVRRWLVRPVDLQDKARRWRELLQRDGAPA